ncbi:unnamed protein product [Darwinula stevensoni]|nr:unnamed protein product [Darwinula stevensoni]CAG0902246.1 unnamed protein product [Darwinula stevensoni]
MQAASLQNKSDRIMARWMRSSFMGRCIQCLALVKWIPVIFVILVVAWSYYAYVVVYCIVILEGKVLSQVLFIILYHLIGGLFMWSYYRTIFTPPGQVPAAFHLSPTALDRLTQASSKDEKGAILAEAAEGLPIRCRNYDGLVRYCEVCQVIKPDRAHHCSVCTRCVLKMDHHCPWVNNCVNFMNYKYFILFMFYAFIFCIYVSLSVLPDFIVFWAKEDQKHRGLKIHVIFLFFVGIMFALSLSFLLFYHMFLVARNRTTLEAFREPILIDGPNKRAFDIGILNNIMQVFGPDILCCFFPTHTALGDGTSFPARHGNRVSYESITPARSHSPVSETQIPMPEDPCRRSDGDFAFYPPGNCNG